MIRRALSRLLLMVVLCPAVAAASGEEPASADSMTVDFAELLAYRFELVLGEERVLDLPIGALVPGSDRLLLDGFPLEPGRDYRLDPVLGRIELTRASPGSLVELHAERQPWGLPRIMQVAPFRSWQDIRAGIEKPTAVESLAPASGAEVRGETGEGSFRMGGSKSLVLRMGDGEDLAIEQSLRLQLQGNISDSTRVEAVLRDDDLPFQAEGNTERLEELDKVFLRVHGPAGSAQVGDFVFAAPERKLTPFRRDFQGIQGEWRGRAGAMGLWLARSKGLFQSVEFYGSAGLQGPYELLSALRESGAVILAGSESVYLNGTALTRGRNRDYVIDYDLGTLTFSSRRLLGEGDIIRVDFRYSQENWRRGAWGARAGGTLGALRLDLLHFEEKDDPEDPLAFPLDDERRVLLEAAGDDMDLAVTGGIHHRPGQGRYILSHEDPENPELDTYAWVDSLGDYDLRLRDVGAGRGDYSATGVSGDGERIFAYAGAGQGAFLLGEQLAAPESYRLESLRLDWSAGGLSATGELALSDRDANLLSVKNDADNGGLALRAGLEGELGSPAGRLLVLDLGLERREASFHFPGASRGAADYRRWNLPWRPDPSEESRGRAALAWGADRYDSARVDAEALRLGDRFEGLLGGLAAGGRWRGLGLRGEFSALATQDSLLGEGSREDALVEFRTPWPLWRSLTLSAGRASQERPDSLDGQISLEQRGNHRREAMGLLLGSRGSDRPWSVDWREERFRSPGASRDRLRRLGGKLDRSLPGAGRLGLAAQYRKRWGGSENEQFQAEARSIWLARPGRWGGELVYRLGSRRQRLRQSRIVFVGLGQGDLNEDGVYLGESEGDYRRLSVQGEESVRTQDLELEARLQRMEEREGSVWRRLGGETRLALREENRDEDPWRLAALDPSRFRRPGQTLLGSLELSQELRFRPLAGGREFRYRFRSLDRLDERDSGGGREELERDHRLRVRFTGERSSLESTVFHTRRSRLSAEGAGGNYRVRDWGAELGATRHLGRKASLSIEAKGQRRRDGQRALALRELALAPGLSVSPAKSFRIDASWEFSHSRYDEGDPGAGRPWFFDAPGWKRSLRIEATTQAGDNLTLSARYELREENDEERRQRLRMEGRAYF